MNSAEAENTKQAGTLPARPPVDSRTGKGLDSYFFHPIHLRSCFSDFKNVLFQLFYFSFLCASFQL